MKITLYMMYKRHNSTKQPTDTTVKVEVDNVQLKDDTSLYHPTFLLAHALIDFEYGSYNYLKWYDRYYFIDDKIKPTISGAWEIQCSLDYLATFKDQILETYAFVVYSTNNYDAMIPDKRLSFPSIKQFSDVEYKPLRDTNLDPSIVVSYISAKDSGYGSVAYASLNVTQLQQLNAYLMSEAFQDSLNKQLNDTASAIVGCQLFPFTIPGTTVTSSMNVLGVDTGITAALIQSYGTLKGTLTFTWPADSSHFNGDFRDLEPYTGYILFLPCIGYIDLSCDYINSLAASSSNLVVSYIIDLLTGGISYDIPGVGKFDGAIAVNIPTAYSGINAINTISNGISAVGNAASIATFNTTAIPSMLEAAFNTVVSSMQKNCGMIGSNSGSRASQLIQPKDYGNKVLNAALYRSTLKGVIDPADISTTLGRPTNKILKISTCVGYVQTSNASVALKSPKHVCESVNAMLDSGIYIE